MSSVKTAVLIVAIALVYALSGRLGLMLAIPPGYATAIFPAAGVALAAVLLYGRWALPAVWFGSFGMNLWVGVDAGRELHWAALPVPALIACGALLQAWAGAWLMQRWVGVSSALDDERDIIKFIVLCGVLGCLVGASVGTGTLWYFDAVATDKVMINWANWWLGDVIGVLIMVPVLFAFLAQPREQWRSRRFTLSVPLAIAVGFVLAAYIGSSRWEQQRIDEQFSYRAGQLGDQLEAMLKTQLELLSRIARFYDSQDRLDRAKFHSFVDPILDAHPEFLALEWAEHVTDAQRSQFEARMRREGYPQFQITERDTLNRMVRAAPRPEYFPVTYVAPWSGNEVVIGFDVASEAERRAALERMRSLGRPALTARVQLAQQSAANAGWGVLMYFPVMDMNGVVLGVVPINTLITAVMHPSDRELFSIELTDLSAPSGKQNLYGGAATDSSQHSALTNTRTIALAGRQWQVRYQATPAYLQQHTGWQSWLVLAAGLLFTSLLEIFLLSISGRTTRVERLIELRTRELNQTNRMVNEAQRIAHLGHWMWDLKTNEEFWSAEQARIFGLEPNMLTISHEVFVQALHPEDREEVVNAIQAALIGQSSYRVECRIHQRSGAQRHVHCEGEVERDAASTPVRMFGIVYDISDRKRAEAEIMAATDEALRANRAKSEFLSSMSHELRTPLNAVLGFAQLMSYDQQLSAPQQSTVTKIRHAGEHLLNLINDVLDLSRIEVGHVNLSMEAVELDSLLSECVSLIQPLADARGLRFSAERSCVGVYVQVDRTRLKQSVVNLLSNAVKYNREHGEIELACELCDGNVNIRVRDTGRGMSPEQQAHLFQPFNRLGQERGEIEGTGIGLVITKRLVELMNGAMSLHSVVEQGSTFTIELLQIPAPLPAAQKVQTVAAKASPVTSAAAFTLLSVEDNPANMELVQVLVANIWPKACFIGAASAEAGLDIAFSQDLDVILMDINLPGMDGYAALERLKVHPRTAHLPVLALTANAMPDDIRRGKAAGFTAYLTKPLDMALLIATVNALLVQRTAAPKLGRRILVAEDNLVNQEIMRAMVGALGYELDVVDDGTEALEAVQQTVYAMVLMDCEMPQMNGYDATRAIRALTGAVAQIPVVAVSAHAADEDAEKRSQAGMTDVLPKPVNVAQLKAMLERYVQSALKIPDAAT